MSRFYTCPSPCIREEGGKHTWRHSAISAGILMWVFALYRFTQLHTVVRLIIPYPPAMVFLRGMHMVRNGALPRIRVSPNQRGIISGDIIPHAPEDCLTFYLKVSRAGKGKNKFCSNALGTDYVYIFPVRLDNFLYNRKPQSSTLLVLASG